MVIGIGTDIVQIDRIAKVIERQGEKFAHRILTPAEQQEFTRLETVWHFWPSVSLPKKPWLRPWGQVLVMASAFMIFNVINDNKGAPAISLSGGAETVMRRRGGSQVLLSLADEAQYAIAYAVLT